MNNTIVLLGVFALLLSASPVFAEEVTQTAPQENPAVERTEHYEHATFTDSTQAVAALNEKVAEISQILGKDGGIDFAELESVHEKTYTLESVVTHFRTNKTYDEARIDALDEAVQTLHSTSENQDLNKTRESFVKVQDATAALSAPAQPAKAETKDFYEIVIKDHKFSPAELRVPAGQKIKLIVDNQDPTPEEFESHDLNREKIIAGSSKATIFVGPLKPGKYHFFGEFNMATAKGDIIAE